jgi:hypothetical protein
LTYGAEIDPDDWAGGLGPLLFMDSNRIYGSRIWQLYKDVCNQSLVRMLAVLRAWQLGFISGHALHHAIDNCGEGLDVDELLGRVQERLPRFGCEEA